MTCTTKSDASSDSSASDFQSSTGSSNCKLTCRELVAVLSAWSISRLKGALISFFRRPLF